MAGLALNIFLLGGMSMGLITTGYDAQTKSQALRDQIAQVKATNDKVNEQYAAIAGDITKLTKDVQDQLTEAGNKYIQLQSLITTAQSDFNDSFKKVQLTGIIILIVVFILLVLKYFGLLEQMAYLLNYPFILLWNFITNKK
jgi:hypothetical protein